MTAMEDGSLPQWLDTAGLTHHLASFQSAGMTVTKLASMTMHDYSSVGVTVPADRRKLFELVQIIKREGPIAAKENVPPSNKMYEEKDQQFSMLANCAALPLDNAGEGMFGLDELAERGPAPGRTPPSAPIAAPRMPRKSLAAKPSAATAAPMGKKSPLADRIRVCVRKRPLNPNESDRGDADVLRVSQKTLYVQEPKQRVDCSTYMEEHAFTFDEVFEAGMTNEQVYLRTAAPLIETVFEGGRATCFAYGQTGSGKTFTMLGKGSSGMGLYALAARDLFARLERHQTVSCSYYEIYGSKMFDLLQNRAKLACREDSKGQVNICGLTEHAIQDVAGMMKVIDDGSSVRAQGATGANADSSRSHAVLTIDVKVPSKNGREQVVFGKFCFIDLAGSERGADTMDTDRITRMEGAEINKSLLALKECIRALDQSARHVPFRGSKLTEVLRDSFQGNSRTAMIANVAPGTLSCEHTLNTLRYADRVKSLSKDKGEKGARTDDFDRVMMIGNVGSRGKKKVPLKKPKQEWVGTGAPPSEKEQKKIDAVRQYAAQQPLEAAPPSAESDMDDRSNATLSDVEGLDSAALIGENGQRMTQDELERHHEKLIDVILLEEEEMISSHRAHVDEIMEVIKEEMAQLDAVDQPGSNIDAYIRNLDGLLKLKQKKITELRSHLSKFKSHLQEEEILSKYFVKAEGE